MPLLLIFNTSTSEDKSFKDSLEEMFHSVRKKHINNLHIFSLLPDKKLLGENYVEILEKIKVIIQYLS
jgi:hypothetical protein